LPPAMVYPPTIRKVNPADTPILVLALTSDTLPLTTVDAYTESERFEKFNGKFSYSKLGWVERRMHIWIDNDDERTERRVWRFRLPRTPQDNVHD